MMTDILREQVESFPPISLEEMESVRLMDRTDTKFTFNVRKLPAVLDLLKDKYRVFEINGVRLNRYETLYFDTQGFDLYIKHHNKKQNRYKVRARKYVDSNLHFFEVKFKNNKGRTIKNRVKRPEIESVIARKSADLIVAKTPLDPASLVPKLWVNYTRITFVSNNLTERVTVDINLQFKNDLKLVDMNEAVIIEVKQDGNKKSPFIDALRQNKIAPLGFSKYCLAVISLHPEIKKNSFKPKLLQLNKTLQNVTPGTSTGRV